ncbi:complement component 1 Q subcomponent-binding protein, mitochondrial-like [Acropora muricata]|uniref:complement component 1 Q subcomponent-binding protein, mitochondrial-like n=1 Tax=Acropora millepora TaxID=45264 RepID=UPI0010FC8698|nr:complement component 1 Q subcomponent-binding protein, mitochondrial-like [Acropora millepora]
MSTFCGLAGLFSRRSARFLFSRNVSNSLVGCCRSRSIFAATTRGASQSKGLVIACACAKVCACEKHNYSRADSKLMDFLKQEIQHEKSAASTVPSSMLFEPNIDGTHVKLEREHNGERIVLSFDLNENLNQDEGDADEEMYDEEVVMAEGKIKSYPLFTVEITKKSGHTLKFYCEFDPDFDEDDELTSDGEGGHDSVAPVMVHIINVSVMDTPGRDKEKTIYSAETENMDKSMYLMLLNMLAERGVDNEFCQWLLDYSTALEQQHYIKFLEDLQNFVKLQ